MGGSGRYLCVFTTESIMYIHNQYIYYKKSMETTTVFNETEMKNEWNVNFIQNNPIGIKAIPSSLPLVEAPLELFLLTRRYI